MRGGERQKKGEIEREESGGEGARRGPTRESDKEKEIRERKGNRGGQQGRRERRAKRDGTKRGEKGSVFLFTYCTSRYRMVVHNIRRPHFREYI